MMNFANGTDVIVFSSEKFNSNELRTSELMKEFALKKRVYFFNEPIIGVSEKATYFIKKEEHEVIIIQPYLSCEDSIFEQKMTLLNLLKELIIDENISHYTMWTDTPQAMYFIKRMSPELIIYDCIKNYSLTHKDLENELLEYADVVLTSALTSDVPVPLTCASAKPFLRFSSWNQEATSF